MGKRSNSTFRSRLKPGMLVESSNQVLPCMCHVLSAQNSWWEPPQRVELRKGEVAVVVEKHSSSIGATAPVWVLLLNGMFVATDELSLRVVKEEA